MEVIMKRLIKLTVTFVIILISVCGCNDLKRASKNTSIDKVNSYRAKVSIKSDNFKEDYIVFNKGNNEYIVNFTNYLIFNTFSCGNSGIPIVFYRFNL